MFLSETSKSILQLLSRTPHQSPRDILKAIGGDTIHNATLMYASIGALTNQQFIVGQPLDGPITNARFSITDKGRDALINVPVVK